MKKQTAVDYLVEQLESIGFSTNDLSEFYNEIEIAKQMEKEQIMDAWDEGLCTRSMHDICSEYYYNDTFKGGRG
jgi:hypothetical protein